MNGGCFEGSLKPALADIGTLSSRCDTFSPCDRWSLGKDLNEDEHLQYSKVDGFSPLMEAQSLSQSFGKKLMADCRASHCDKRTGFNPRRQSSSTFENSFRTVSLQLIAGMILREADITNSKNDNGISESKLNTYTRLFQHRMITLTQYCLSPHYASPRLLKGSTSYTLPKKVW